MDVCENHLLRTDGAVRQNISSRHTRRNGFFIEAGAGDGETISNSLYFEIYHEVTHFNIITYIHS